MTGTPVGGRVATAANPLRCAVLISGSGSGMEAMVKAQQQHDLFHTTSVVISNRSEAGGIQLAKKLGVKVELVLPPNDAENTRTSHEDLIMQILQQYDIEFVVLSGYMRLLSPHILESWGGRIVNIHPSYLPHFPGAHAHRDVLASGARLTGCTVHMVDEGMDSGVVLAQETVPVLSSDDESSLSNRVKVEEHRLYPRVLSWIAQGFVTIKSGKVHLDVPQVPQND
ncbi:MAG: phosphoribosylglycinamide formyltransferase [Candidatus Poseidonia sp.]|uniref:phosphoribosylglycinamide formyltransferase n=1 Tax=Poseidonia sp. TaxID=2666344 RepID=UPI0030BE8BAF|nr:phosphoribosylglycinamide formyltransferase [Poseidonia sp.]